MTTVCNGWRRKSGRTRRREKNKLDNYRCWWTALVFG